VKQPGVLKDDTNKGMFMLNSALEIETQKIWDTLGMLNL
jgi:hypothetical protein